ncbi:DUF882 domain-containing protein [Massilia sp. DWR3-1-1]|uniref:DUF882 domain-containing protein n=1 Tax=Massilia sp. DWR3-1-1 TaxID=2804559 RepID=UPI003CF010E1
MTQRRDFFKRSAVLATALGVPMLGRTASAAAAPLAARRDRTLSMYNTHTGESIKATYWAEGRFVPESLSDINKLLRDHRNNKVAPIDPALLLLLDQVSTQVKPGGVVHIISGYRSPETNQLLADTTNGVARHSMHLDGRAIDVRMPGTALTNLRGAALRAAGGGVGYYADSQFVHLDTGRVRHW